MEAYEQFKGQDLGGVEGFRYQKCKAKKQDGPECGDELKWLSIKPKQGSKEQYWLACDHEGCENFQVTDDKKRLELNMNWASLTIKMVAENFEKIKAAVKKESEVEAKLREAYSTLTEAFGEKYRELCRERVAFWTKELHETEVEGVSPYLDKYNSELTALKTKITEAQSNIRAKEKDIIQIKSYLNTNLFTRNEDVVKKTDDLRVLSEGGFKWAIDIHEITTKNVELTKKAASNHTKLAEEYNKNAVETFNKACVKFIKEGFFDKRTHPEKAQPEQKQAILAK